MKHLLLLSSFVFAAPALAQDGTPTVDETCCVPASQLREQGITVVATGTRLAIEQTGQSISVIDDRELRSIQGADLTRALERLPGVTFSRNGAPGGFTGVRVRGADAEQLLVVIDGVRTADIASPGGGFDLGNLLAGNVARMDLLRGSNSVAWGSQAIGGVLAVTTVALNGVAASAEYGADETIYATAAAGLKRDTYSASLAASFHDSDGISAAAVGSEPDGFRQYQLTGKARVELGRIALVTNGRYAEGRLDIDGFPAPLFAFADTPEFQDTREVSGRAGAEFTSDSVDLAGGFALSDTRRELFDPTFGTASNYTTKGRSERAELTGVVRLPADFRLDFGADREWTRFSSTFDTPKHARQTSGHALLGYHTDTASLSGGARYDRHNRFGGEWTLGANGSVNLAGDWRARASYGEGFKTPTLFQLLSDFGNAGLTPERSRSFDAGVERGDRNGTTHFAVTFFRRDSRDLIDFVSCFGSTAAICTWRPFGTYDNVRRARAEGFEIEGNVRPVEGLQLRAAYSYVKATNRDTGNDLARRPRHALSVSGDWTLDQGRVFATTLGADVRLVGDSFDNAGNTTRLDGHVLLTLRASRPLLLLDAASQRTLDLFGRVENVGDADYQTVAGYGTPGRSAHVGVRLRL